MVHLSCGSLCCIYRDYHAYRNHLKRYGHPSDIGYKDVLRTWNPTNLDPERLTELYQKAGARFLMIQGVHHDNYDLWNSRYQPWNSIVNSCNGQAGTSDSYTSKAITCDKDITIEGGTFNIVMSGTGGKGVKTDDALVIGKDDGTGPAMKIATTGSKLSGGSTSGSTQPGSNRPGRQGRGWGSGTSSSSGSSSKAIKAKGVAHVKGGSLYVTTATDGAEGLESKTSITISGGTHYFQC